MRVLHITPTYRPEIGGIETVIEKLCQNLNERNYDSEVAYLAPGLTNSRTEISGVRIHNVGLIGHKLLGISPRLQQIAENFDLLHVHDPQMFALSINVALFGKGKPAVLSTHGGFHHTKNLSWIKSSHERFLLKKVLGRYSAVLASSESDLEWISKYTERAILCQNGVDIFNFGASIEPNQRSPWDWIYWGRFSANKRIDLSLKLAEFARSLGKPVTLTFCGRDFDGTGANIRSYCEYKKYSWVKFETADDNEELLELIKANGVFVTSSEYEGFGLTAIEALSAGLPVICRNIRPLNNFVSDECGLTIDFLIDDFDSAGFESFLGRLETEYKELSANAVFAANKYDWSTAILPFMSAYTAAQSDGRNLLD